MSDDITVTPKSTPAGPNDKSYVSTDLARLDIGNILGIANPLQIQHDTKLTFVIDQLSDEGKASKGDIMQRIRDLQTKLGTPRYGHGESALGAIYNYLRAESHLKEATKVRNSFLA